MGKAIVLPLYLFPNISWIKAFAQSEEVVLDVFENWVKQSYRNRYEIAGPNGSQSLSVPTEKKTRIRLKDVKISYAEDWVTNHMRSVQTAYNRSPFYEHYVSDFENMLKQKPAYLVDLNLSAMQWGLDKLQLEKKWALSTEYTSKAVDKQMFEQSSMKYQQVFEERNGFISGLSYLDVLFNRGPESNPYLT
jgi:hypothetical protein